MALCCLLLAVGSALAARPAPRRGDPGRIQSVVVLTRDLPAGAVLASADVTVASWPVALAPPGALARAEDAVGHRLGGAMGAREPVTRARLIGAELTTGLPSGTAAMTVALASAGAADLVKAGDFVDLLIGPAGDGLAGGSGGASQARVVAEQVRVLAVLTGAGPVGQTELAVAVDQATALRLAAVASQPLLAVVRGPPAG